MDTLLFSRHCLLFVLNFMIQISEAGQNTCPSSQTLKLGKLVLIATSLGQDARGRLASHRPNLDQRDLAARGDKPCKRLQCSCNAMQSQPSPRQYVGAFHSLGILAAALPFPNTPIRTHGPPFNASKVPVPV